MVVDGVWTLVESQSSLLCLTVVSRPTGSRRGIYCSNLKALLDVGNYGEPFRTCGLYLVLDPATSLVPIDVLVVLLVHNHYIALSRYLSETSLKYLPTHDSQVWSLSRTISGDLTKNASETGSISCS